MAGFYCTHSTPTPETRVSVWEPVKHNRWDVPAPDMEFTTWTATVLCGDGEADGCNHLNCREGRFVVVFVGATPSAGTVSGCVYYTHGAGWGDVATVEATVDLIPKPATLVGSSLFFRSGGNSFGRIVQYDMPSSHLSTLDPPTHDGAAPVLDFVLLPAPNDRQRLLLATIRRSAVEVWEAEVAARANRLVGTTTNDQPVAFSIQHPALVPG